MSEFSFTSLLKIIKFNLLTKNPFLFFSFQFPAKQICWSSPNRIKLFFCFALYWDFGGSIKYVRFYEAKSEVVTLAEAHYLKYNNALQ